MEKVIEGTRYGNGSFRIGMERENGGNIKKRRTEKSIIGVIGSYKKRKKSQRFG